MRKARSTALRCVLGLANVIAVASGCSEENAAAPCLECGATDSNAGGEVADGKTGSASGDDASVPGADAGDGPDAGGVGQGVAFPVIDPSVLTDAIGQGLTYYRRNGNGEPYCGGACDGAPVMLAVAAYAGQTAADARLLQQMRHVLGNGNDPIGNGAYVAVLERDVTAMFAIARRVPRVWGQLTAAEVEKIDLIMKATLVADAYMTSDASAKGVAEVTSLDGETASRDHNPNYREGMIGAVLVSTAYFGGQGPAEAILDNYDHVAFTAELGSKGLQNLWSTFSTYVTKPSAGAPSPETVQKRIKSYRLYGMTLGQLLDIYLNLTNDTFGKKVSCGLDGGAGITVSGKRAGVIVSGCAGLPNLGAIGMEKEFDSVDANGARSSAGYAYLGTRANMFHHLVLVAHGLWQTTSATSAAYDRMAVGVTDFFYKAQHGYVGYSKGKVDGTFSCSDTDCALNHAFFTQVIAKLH